jgi:class 3 adenylate cyclase
MSLQPSLPDDARLASVAETLTPTRSAIALFDAGWRLRWISPELKKLLGEEDEEKLGYGEHVLRCWMLPAWYEALDDAEKQMNAFSDQIPGIVYDTEGGKEAVLAGFMEAVQAEAERTEGEAWFCSMTDEEVTEFLASMEPREPSPVSMETFQFKQGDLPAMGVVGISVRLHDIDRNYFGNAIFYNAWLPATIHALLSRGDEGMHTRMARLSDPDRRAAAILFADLQESGKLSRRLPSAAYFQLIRALTTAIDDVIGRHQGIVGKHAGDGATAFFLAEDLGGSHSSAARASIEAARALTVAVRDVAKEIAEETGLIDDDECLFNVGLHWGGTLFMGQLVTGGRLEVTALGDEVNEGARIQESARDGAILASKALVERLSSDDAIALGIDRDRLLYRTLGELKTVSDKAKRDAGGLPVTTIR